MLLSESYMETKEYKDRILRNFLSSTLIETNLGGVMEATEKEEISHEDWLEEGGIENSTHDNTLEEQCQKDRILWLCKQATGDRVLELGCNYGYILDAVCKYINADTGMGVDINPKNISKALNTYKDCFFRYGDITKTRDMFRDNSFDTVMIPDVLEHIVWEKVLPVVKESMRIASHKVLITLPLEEKKKRCFKHAWIPDKQRVFNIVNLLQARGGDVVLACNFDFYYIECKLKEEEN